jgi:heme A synthase
VSAPARSASARTRSSLYSAVIGLASLGVLLQGVWAGIFVREHEDYAHSWVEVHARGAEVTIVLGVIAFLVAVWQLRSRRDVVVGTAVFAVLLVLEAYIGGEIGGHPGLQVVHFPLAMALLALAVWLPLRAILGSHPRG